MSDLPAPPAPMTSAQPQPDATMANLLYGVGNDNQFNYRLWRVERGNPRLRAGQFLTQAQPTGNPALYSKTNANALTASGDINPAASGVGNLGSTPKSQAYPNFTFTANTPNQLVIAWPNYGILRNDGSSVLLTANQIQTDGLTGNTLYFFYPFWSESAKQIGWVNSPSVNGGNGQGTPAIGYTTDQILNRQQQNLAGNISFGVIQFTMPNIGSSSGTSGGSGNLGAKQVPTYTAASGGGNRLNLV